MPISHNLGSFARRIRQVAAGVEPAVDDTLRKVALVANQTVIMATPVDTGRARANWQVSIVTHAEAAIDNAIGADIDTDNEGTTDTNFAETMRRNQATIRGYRNGSIILQNNVPYIGRLNDGWSAQAPAGFVEKALQSAARAVAQSKVVKK